MNRIFNSKGRVPGMSQQTNWIKSFLVISVGVIVGYCLGAFTFWVWNNVSITIGG